MDQALMYALVGVGGAAVIVGAVLVGLGYHEAAQAPKRVSMAPWISPHGAGTSLELRF